ncbi:MAG: F0F1 ATP synthase subunit A [Lachnospiraceae bacterium]|nr:F0F1 ATP synthase subunit A [Lachnospiraceae bacterium]
MEKKKLRVFLIVWIALIAAILAAIFLVGLPRGHTESVKVMMKDAVLHGENRISLFGLNVNPALISSYIVTAVLLLAALIIRIFAIPRFKDVPGKFQTVIEMLVEFFADMAKSNSPHRTGFVAAYIFGAGVYVFFGTLFELFGLQAVTTHGTSITLPAPLADINGAIAMGFLSFGVIWATGFIAGGPKGGLKVLKDFSLPISMSFRLFGALLSGLLVTELVYYYVSLSFVLPVLVGVLFTIMHALIQTYVLTTLVSVFYGEAAEPPKKKEKKDKIK